MNEKSASGRRYDCEFKEDAVALVRAGRTVSSVARDLGVTTWSLGRWVQAANGGQAQREPATLAAETAEQRELRRLRQENDYLRQQRDILKRAPKHLVSGEATARHTLMETMKSESPIAVMAEALEVSKSGFFTHRHKEAGPRRQEDACLIAAIEPIFEESWQRYGSPRVVQALRERGQRCGKNRVARLMRASRVCVPSRSGGTGGPKPPTATIANLSPRTGWRRCLHLSAPIRCG